MTEKGADRLSGYEFMIIVVLLACIGCVNNNSLGHSNIQYN